MGVDALNPAAAVEFVAGVATSRNSDGASTTVGNAAF
jgi:hypothetical protein